MLRVWAGSATPINHNFNPFAVDTAVHATFGAIYEPLFFFNQLSSDPATGLIGDSYEYSEDGKTLTVKIKPDLKWNDGEPLTADDVVFTFGYGSNKSDKLVSAEATDDTTVVFTYTEPQFTSASLLLGSTWIIPQHIWESIDDYISETNPEPVGSGPYKVKSFSDAAYTVEANCASATASPPSRRSSTWDSTRTSPRRTCSPRASSTGWVSSSRIPTRSPRAVRSPR